MAAEHWSILLKKHFVWTDTIGLSDNVISQQKAAVDRVRWESKEQCPQQTPPTPQPPSQHSFPKKKTTHPDKHFWLILGGTNWKQIKANGHWATLLLYFPRARSQMETHFLPCLRWWGGRGEREGVRLPLPCPIPMGPNGPKWGPTGTSRLKDALWADQAPLTFQKTILGSWEGALRLINKEDVALIKFLSKVMLSLRSLSFLCQNMLLGLPQEQG